MQRKPLDTHNISPPPAQTARITPHLSDICLRKKHVYAASEKKHVQGHRVSTISKSTYLYVISYAMYVCTSISSVMQTQTQTQTKTHMHMHTAGTLMPSLQQVIIISGCPRRCLPHPVPLNKENGHVHAFSSSDLLHTYSIDKSRPPVVHSHHSPTHG